MTQINLDPGLLRLVKKNLEDHPIYKELDLTNHTRRVETVLKDFVVGNYVLVKEDEFEQKIQDIISKMQR